MHTHMLQPADAHNYIISGHGKFTLVGQTTRYTYKVSQVKDNNGNLSPLFISVLTGPDNSNDYQYIGFIPLRELYMLTAGRKGNSNHPAFKALSWWLWAFITKNPNIDKAEFWHEGTCCRCGRELTVPESIASGIGPVCAGKLVV